MKGFTFIELIMAIGIILIIAVAASPLYGNLQVSSQLNENTTQIIQTIRTARENSVARLNNASYGVYFEINAGDDRYILYQGPSYALRDSSYDRIITLDGALSFSTTLTSDEVNFSKGLGEPNSNGVVTLTHDVGGVKTISINDFGKVEEN